MKTWCALDKTKDPLALIRNEVAGRLRMRIGSENHRDWSAAEGRRRGNSSAGGGQTESATKGGKSTPAALGRWKIRRVDSESWLLVLPTDSLLWYLQRDRIVFQASHELKAS